MQRFTKVIAAIMLMLAVVCAAGCNKDDNSGSGSENNGNNDSDVRVTTYTPQEVTQTSAVCGGDAIVVQGLSLTELGVCWSKERNPTVADLHLFTSNWNEPFVCTISSLEPGTKYYVRAYVLRGLEYYYGNEKTITTKNDGYELHTWVDLGLPSGILWADCNVGADTPEGYGKYFAWGETAQKSKYDFSTYIYCHGDYDKLTKYCDNAGYGNNGFTDNLTVLQMYDDAATANCGGDWRTPTYEEWIELYENTTSYWTTHNGVTGRLFVAPNENSLFLPAAGYQSIFGFSSDVSLGLYWSSSLFSDYSYYASGFIISSENCVMSVCYRNCGQSVRAVRLPH